MAKILIHSGTLLSSSGQTLGDVLIEDEIIGAIGAPGYFSEVASTCDKVIDATGKYVLPGGIDVHTHMELPFGGTAASDSFATGSTAAAWGGTTSIIDFAVQRTGEDVYKRQGQR